MRIAVIGTQCVGKTTFIDDFLKTWPMYKRGDTSYRELAKKNAKVTLNREGTEEGQQIIRDALVDDMMKYTSNDNVIFDRCILDNLVYSLWLYEKKKNLSDMFMETSFHMCREAMKFIDVVFYIPLLEKYPVKIVKDQDGQRDIDPVYREEIANIYKSVAKSYYDHKSAVFAMDDSPALIEIFGTREERIAMTKLYINEEGQVYGDDQSLIVPPSKEMLT